VSAPVIGEIVTAVLFVLTVLALVLRVRELEKSINQLPKRLSGGHREQRDTSPKETVRREDLEQWKTELHRHFDRVQGIVGSIGPRLDRIEAEMERHGASSSQEPARYGTPSHNVSEDGAAQLLLLANRIVQQGSTTLDAMRANTNSMSNSVSALRNENPPSAFIVEHRGTCYAVPNVVKPARLPKEWFNRDDFGVNDEIRRVIVLPRLKRRGNEFEVEEAGVFAR
jgi:hypothetical protein